MSDEEHTRYAKSPRKIDLSDLRKQRGTLKGRLTLFEKYINRFADETNLSITLVEEIKLRIHTASTLFTDYNRIQSSLEQYCNETELVSYLDDRDQFEAVYYKTMATANCLINTIVTESSNSSKCNASIKLPDIRLPTFDGHFDHWLEYRNSFITMIHNRTDLDSIHKFHYLKSSLTSNALQVISALEFTADNYSHAWQLLENRFNNYRLLVHNHVKSLFNIPSIQKESSMQLRKLIDTILRNLRSLNTLGEPTAEWDTLIIYLIVSKLDIVTEREWEHYIGLINTQSSGKTNGKIKLDDLLKFLRDRADMLEMTKVSSNKSHESTPKPSQLINYKKSSSYNQNHNMHSYHTSSKSKPNKERVVNCLLCKDNHALYLCTRFLNLSVKERIQFVIDNNLCRNCLRLGHTHSTCLFSNCKQCNKNHNSLLHLDNYSESNTQQNIQTTTAMLTGVNNNLISSLCSTDNRVKLAAVQPVLLSTALIMIADRNNQYHTVRALLDNGSERCFITKSLCEKLNVNYLNSTVSIAGVGQSVTNSSQSCEILIKSNINDYKKRIRCLVLSNITQNLPPTYLDVKSITIPNHIKLADPDFYISSKIDLLIGADLFWDLLKDGRFRLPTGPYLQNTQLGWIVSGTIYSNKYTNMHKYAVNELNENINCHLTQSLDSQLRQFWELEEVSLKSIKLSTEDQQCEDIFASTTTRDLDGRFVVCIPLQRSPDELGDTYEIAKNRFLSLERKLQRLPDYREKYTDFMNEYLKLGHMSPINEYTKPYYFLPHHGVIRDQSTTTKLRVVFNASANSDSGVSLNDLQYIGPSLHTDTFSLLLRFRQHKFVALADIEKMFRQISVHKDQRNLQLIIWRDNPNKPLQIYQLNTVTYGTASAPFLSMRCLRQLAQECDDDVISAVINNDMFVDDLITGNDDKNLLISICDRVSKVLMSGCFPLRKWTFNTTVDDVDTPCSKQLTLGEHCQTKTLGIGWYNHTDELHFISKIDNNNKPVTKRIILSILSQIYDPLGLLSPVIVIAKILLQKLWLCKIGWDDSIPVDIASSWNNFLTSLQDLGNIRIPRHVVLSKIIELHIFTDASQDAYGACVYVRSCDENDSTTAVRLLCAKSKVAPLKTITVPRLELCGALIGAKLYVKIKQSLSLEFDKVYFWTDSTIVLGWLRMSPSSLKTFVQNRIVQINDLTSNAIWRHVNGTSNPADILSRGTKLSSIQVSDMWWYGPSFLQHPKQFWPSPVTGYDNLEDSIEVKRVALPTSCVGNTNFIEFERFSSLNRLQRATAYVLRFIKNTRHKNNRNLGPLTVDELQAALTLLTRLAQQQSFPTEYTNLKNNLPIKSKRNLLSLNLFMDKDYLIRVGGRLENSSFAYDKCHPLLLCNKHHFSLLVFRSEHLRLLHGGPTLLLSSVRARWWVLRGRDLARRVVHHCVVCARFVGNTINPLMGNLPAQRLDPGSPFLKCGVDYAGPILMLNRKGRGAKLEKSYICLFICFVTRALHLELVTTLSTEGYLLAFKRFISRRGKPAEVFSDNGRNFVGAMNEFKSFLTNNAHIIQENSENDGIKFHFIPVYAPHFGGLWEAGVRSCKHHLRRVVGNAHLTYEELSTVLTQIEAVLNSRPLTPLSSDANDLSPLSPAHFLVGRPLSAPACADVSSVPVSTLSRYHRVEQLRQHFWSRWSKEYVSELQQRTKWRTNTESLQLNTMVLLKEDLPPLRWRMGRIVKLYPGADGISRVADVLTEAGVVRRAFDKICPLPIESTT